MRLVGFALLLVCSISCNSRGVPPANPPLPPETPLPLAGSPLALVVGNREVDILAVVDASGSSVEPEDYRGGYRELFEKLLGDPGTAADIRVGAITGNLGNGPYDYILCSDDGARLLTKPRYSCAPPRDAWVTYANGETNVPGTGDALFRFLQGFGCIASWGSNGGCSFQQFLEAARRALDPRLGINPGFLRENALLLVATVADHDDCSVARTELFSNEKSAVEKLGPLTSFRCVELGWECEEPLRPVGEKHNCRPAQDWLVKVEEYVQFLRALRPGRVIFFALSGPPSPVVVGRDGTRPVLQASCASIGEHAAPSIRLEAMADALGPQGLFNPSNDVCAVPMDPAFRTLGETVLRSLGSQCLPAPLVTAGGGLVCSAGEEVAPGVTCAASCLELADCTVEEVKAASPDPPVPIPRCPAAIEGTDCGESCPCWRLVRMPELCAPRQTGSPYALQVLRETGLLAPFGTHALARCRTTSARWGSTAMATAIQCR